MLFRTEEQAIVHEKQQPSCRPAAVNGVVFLEDMAAAQMLWANVSRDWYRHDRAKYFEIVENVLTTRFDPTFQLSRLKRCPCNIHEPLKSPAGFRHDGHVAHSEERY